MQLQSTRSLSLPQEQAWDVLNDVEVLKRCIPGCQGLSREPDGALQATVVAKVGPVSAKFNGRVTFEGVAKPSSYRLVFSGQGGAAGFAKGYADVHLEPLEEGTRLTYTTVASVGGKLAQIGSRLIEGTAKKLADDFFDRLEEEVRMSTSVPELSAPVLVGNLEGSPAPMSEAAKSSTAVAKSGGTRRTTWLIVGAIVLLIAVVAIMTV